MIVDECNYVFILGVMPLELYAPAHGELDMPDIILMFIESNYITHKQKIYHEDESFTHNHEVHELQQNFGRRKFHQEHAAMFRCTNY